MNESLLLKKYRLLMKKKSLFLSKKTVDFLYCYNAFELLTNCTTVIPVWNPFDT